MFFEWMLSPPAIQSQLNQRYKLVREVSGFTKLCLSGVPISVLRIPVTGFSHQFTVDQVHAMYLQPLTDEFTVLANPMLSLTLGTSRCFSSRCYLHLQSK